MFFICEKASVVHIVMLIFPYFSQQAMFFFCEKASVVHIVMKKMNKWKLSFWWMDANSLRKVAKILPSSGSMIVEIDTAGSGMDEH